MMKAGGSWSKNIWDLSKNILFDENFQAVVLKEVCYSIKHKPVMKAAEDVLVNQVRHVCWDFTCFVTECFAQQAVSMAE